MSNVVKFVQKKKIKKKKNTTDVKSKFEHTINLGIAEFLVLFSFSMPAMIFYLLLWTYIFVDLFSVHNDRIIWALSGFMAALTAIAIAESIYCNKKHIEKMRNHHKV